MKLKQKDLELIRQSRIDAYKAKIDEYASSRMSFTYFNSAKIEQLIDEIQEVDQELNEKFPKWDDIPF